MRGQEKKSTLSSHEGKKIYTDNGTVELGNTEQENIFKAI
jgi:hypothetical protein